MYAVVTIKDSNFSKPKIQVFTDADFKLKQGTFKSSYHVIYKYKQGSLIPLSTFKKCSKDFSESPEYNFLQQLMLKAKFVSSNINTCTNIG